MEVAVQDTPFNREFIPSITGDAQIRLYQTKIAPPGEDPKFVNLTYGIDKVRQVHELKTFSDLHVFDSSMAKLLALGFFRILCRLGQWLQSNQTYIFGKRKMWLH